MRFLYSSASSDEKRRHTESSVPVLDISSDKKAAVLALARAIKQIWNSASLYECAFVIVLAFKETPASIALFDYVIIAAVSSVLSLMLYDGTVLKFVSK
eukprot:IDg16279t1